MRSSCNIYKKVLLILSSVATVLIAADYFPIRPNYSWVYDLIIIEDSVPKYVGGASYTLGNDTLIMGIPHIPVILSFREEGEDGYSGKIEVGYLIEGNPIKFVDDQQPDLESEYAEFGICHSYTGEGEKVIDGDTILFRSSVEYETPCGIFKDCFSLIDKSSEAVIILAPDVGIVGVQYEFAELLLRRHGPGEANEIIDNEPTPTIIKDNNEEPILLRNGRIWIPSAYSGASKILVYTADGRLIARGGKGKDQIDLSNTGSGMRMLLVKIILGDSMFTTRVSIVR